MDDQEREMPQPGAEHESPPPVRRRGFDFMRWVIVILIALVVIVALAVFLGVVRRPYPVPNVKMMSTAEAEATIEAAGFVLGSQTTTATGTKAPGLIVEQAPPGGATAPRRTPIDITVTVEPQTVSMPDLIGMTGAEAKQALEDRLIEPVTVSIPNEGVMVGEVFEQYPIPGADAIQGEVGFAAVSSGIPSANAVSVPQVEGLSLERATQVLKDEGLGIADYYTDLMADVPTGQIIKQVPAYGTVLDPGTDVLVLVSAAAN